MIILIVVVIVVLIVVLIVVVVIVLIVVIIIIVLVVLLLFILFLYINIPIVITLPLQHIIPQLFTILINTTSIHPTHQNRHTSHSIQSNQLHYTPTPWLGYTKIITIHYQSITYTLFIINIYSYHILLYSLLYKFTPRNELVEILHSFYLLRWFEMLLMDIFLILDFVSIKY